MTESIIRAKLARDEVDANPLCRCPGRDGFTNHEGVWVCVQCYKPRLPAELALMSIVLFREGPLDGKAYELRSLLGTSALQLPIVEYDWTPEKVTSPTTGKEARVWVWKGASPEGRNTMQEFENAESQPESQFVDDGSSPQSSSEGKPVIVESDAPESASASKLSTLHERRLRIKAARPEVAALAGLTVPQLARVEADSPRTTDADREAVSKALDQLEANGTVGRGGRGKSPKVVTPVQQ